MTAAWLSDVADRTAAAGLHRAPIARRSGATEVNLASNDYLGLSTHPDVIAGAHAAIDGTRTHKIDRFAIGSDRNGAPCEARGCVGHAARLI